MTECTPLIFLSLLDDANTPRLMLIAVPLPSLLSFFSKSFQSNDLITPGNTPENIFINAAQSFHVQVDITARGTVPRQTSGYKREYRPECCTLPPHCKPSSQSHYSGPRNLLLCCSSMRCSALSRSLCHDA